MAFGTINSQRRYSINVLHPPKKSLHHSRSHLIQKKSDPIHNAFIVERLAFRCSACPPMTFMWDARRGKLGPLTWGCRWGRRTIPLDVLERNYQPINALQRKPLYGPLWQAVLRWAYRGVVYLDRLCFPGPIQVGERPAERWEGLIETHRAHPLARSDI